MRDLFVAGAARQRALAVFDRIDSIKVKPDWAMARVGGVGVSEGAGAIRGVGLQQRAGRTRRHRRRHRAWPRRRAVEHGRVCRHLRRRRHQVRRDARCQDRPVHAEHRWPESGAQRTAQQHRRRLGRGPSRRRGGGRQAGVDASRSRAFAGHGAAVHEVSTRRPGRRSRRAVRERDNEHRRPSRVPFVRSCRAPVSVTWCQARRCLRSTTVQPPSSTRSAAARAPSTS